MTTTRIKDLAEKLGVSTATISRALNDKRGVSVEVRQRILELAAELSFAPNGTGRGLSTARTHTLGFVVQRKAVPAARDPFYLLIMHGIEDEAARAGYHVILSSVAAAPAMRSAGDLPLVREGRVDGLILAGPDIDPRLILALWQAHVPLVLVDNVLQRTPLDAVLSDDREGARAAVAHLVGHGHRRIGFLGGPLTWVSTAERLAGYREALEAAGQDAGPVVHQAETTVESGYEAAHTLLVGPAHPSALLAVNDSMAIGALRALREAGLDAPRDVALAGFDDIDAAQHTTPPLTTVRIFKERLGAVAARRLLDLLAGAAGPPLRTYVGTELIIRQSCGCPPQPGEGG